MSAQLYNSLERVNADLRMNLRPELRPMLLERKRRIIADLDEVRKQEQSLASRFADRNKLVRYVQAYPTGEEAFRCQDCNRIIGRAGTCWPCAREREML